MTLTPKRVAGGAAHPREAVPGAGTLAGTDARTARADTSPGADGGADAPPGQAALVRFLEDRFACALACVECARACALRVSFVELEPATVQGGPGVTSSLEEQLRPRRGAELRRRALLCVEVCDATCRLLSEEAWRDEYTIRLQVEWCRAVALECARACDRTTESDAESEAGPDVEWAAEWRSESELRSESESCGEACRACARACSDFLTTLST
ncbi:hypothetical protein ACFVTY_09695 [Streptomyces sp. NPDC058067]|uniref:hypothetical protein n=1 Tax=Streptomyces sp. NPDC058067 TaxID=3346324 RepID=UPI0036F0B70D